MRCAYLILLSIFTSPPYRVNLRIFPFGRYKNRRRPHPSRRASWVFQHPPRVTLLTHGHPASPLPSPSLTHLTQLHQSARFITFSTIDPFLAPSGRVSQQGQNGPPRRQPFPWVEHRRVYIYIQVPSQNHFLPFCSSLSSGHLLPCLAFADLDCFFYSTAVSILNRFQSLLPSPYSLSLSSTLSPRSSREL
jgi:hypothetical protein